VEEIIL